MTKVFNSVILPSLNKLLVSPGRPQECWEPVALTVSPVKRRVARGVNASRPKGTVTQFDAKVSLFNVRWNRQDGSYERKRKRQI